MRATSVVWFLRLVAAQGLGAYLGAAVAGALALLSGDAFAPGSTWPSALPGFAVVGAVAGMVAAALTRGWLLPGAQRRGPVFTVAGVVTMPLAVAVGELDPTALEAVAVPVVVAGGVASTVVYLRALRRTAARQRRMMYAGPPPAGHH